jgi:hypothetical protein
MIATTATTLSNPAIVLPAVAKTPSHGISQRSVHLGSWLRSTVELDEPIRFALQSPGSRASGSTPISFPRSVEHLSSLLHWRDQTASRVRFDAMERALNNLCFALSYLLESNIGSRLVWLEVLALRGFLPLYLVRPGDDGQRELGDVIASLQRSVVLLGIVENIEPDDMISWTNDRCSSQLDPEEILATAFDVSATTISLEYWSTVNGLTTPQAETNDRKRDRGLWSLAWQLSANSTHIEIPAQPTLGLVSWERIRLHWRELLQTIRSERTNVDRVAGPVTGTLENQTQPVASQSSAMEPINADCRLVEIRCSNDPQLAENLEQCLQQARNDQSILSFAVIKRTTSSETSTSCGRVAGWHSRFINTLIEHSQASELKGFTTEANELALLFPDAERSEVAHWIRECFDSMSHAWDGNVGVAPETDPLVAGIAMVNAPSRSFAVAQLTAGAWRCLEAAMLQGTHAVKTIEVY